MEAHRRLRSRQDEPTAALVTAIDYDGNIYCLAEYYQLGLTPSQHMDNLCLLPGFLHASRKVADPFIFYKNQAQADGDFKSIVDKDNHLRDALKYILLSLPSPSERPKGMRREEIIWQAFENGTYATLGVQMARFDAKEAENSEPVSYRPNWRDQCD